MVRAKPVVDSSNSGRCVAQRLAVTLHFKRCKGDHDKVYLYGHRPLECTTVSWKVQVHVLVRG